MPEMSNQIQHGLQNMNLGGHDSFNSTTSSRSSRQAYDYAQPGYQNDAPHLSPFPKLINPPPNVPPSDEELEATLENARALVLGANDPEMQLAWAADAMIYVGACMDNEDRIAAIKPQSARSSTPRIEHQLKTDAMNIVTFLADQHHPKAEFLRGMWLEWGRFGQREDKKEAFRCYSRAADRGYARAEYRIGMLYESYNDPIKALRHYHRGVDAGDAASCYRLGMMTLRGQHGQQQDYGKAIDLIKHSAQAADENAAQGAYVYGMLLARQLPQVDIPESYLPFDERLARINIEKAAYLKFAKAQLKMGSAYELGSLGCDFNPALSMHYNALASKQGEAEADMALSKWFLVGSEGILPKNEELSYTYAQRAAHSGLATAEFALGYFHEIGMYVPVDLEKSREWYEKAAKHGNDDRFSIAKITRTSRSRESHHSMVQNEADGLKDSSSSRSPPRTSLALHSTMHPYTVKAQELHWHILLPSVCPLRRISPPHTQWKTALRQRAEHHLWLLTLSRMDLPNND
jgi:TPR repeat protein